MSRPHKILAFRLSLAAVFMVGARALNRTGWEFYGLAWMVVIGGALFWDIARMCRQLRDPYDRRWPPH